MKLGDVLKKEREKKGVSVEDTAARLELSAEEYGSLEGGESEAETWGPHLAQLAIALETPTSRLLSDNGRSDGAVEGKCGALVAKHRERRGMTVDALAEQLGLSGEEVGAIERGESPIEQIGPRLLRFAELIDQPIFNLFYPCGLPFQELDDYP